jgi:hypothetical protein
MIFIHCTKNDLYKALQAVNMSFAHNVEFNKIIALNMKGTRWQVTLRVKDSHKKGARLGFMRNNDGNRRHLINACWHVHGYYFEEVLAIAPETVIHAGALKIDKNGGNWQDRNIGSYVDPLQFSRACECKTVIS